MVAQNLQFVQIFPFFNALGIFSAALLVSFVRRKVFGLRTSYTKAERRALASEAITDIDIRRYHAQISWGSYSILLISLFCVLVSIVYTDLGDISISDEATLIIAAFQLGAAGTIMVFADLMHMNGNSPVVGKKDMFRIVNSGIFAGVGSVFLLLSGMQTFSLLISENLMYALCAVEFVAVISFVWVRAIQPISSPGDYDGV